jgi:hypothetical protein
MAQLFLLMLAGRQYKREQDEYDSTCLERSATEKTSSWCFLLSKLFVGQRITDVTNPKTGRVSIDCTVAGAEDTLKVFTSRVRLYYTIMLAPLSMAY